MGVVGIGDCRGFVDTKTRLRRRRRVGAPGTDYNLSPGGYWNVNGRLLRDIYNDTYE